jgi:hypothetical protein
MNLPFRLVPLSPENPLKKTESMLWDNFEIPPDVGAAAATLLPSSGGGSASYH